MEALEEESKEFLSVLLMTTLWNPSASHGLDA